MAAVPQRTLNWLYSIVNRDHYDPNQTYQDPNRTYYDVASALAQYPSLSPRTDVYTYETGFSALLLNLSGTLPVSFRGTVYKFPIALWIPVTYPREPPLVYVVPTQDMVVRVGQHVTLEGRVYHHYLANWAEAWDKSSILDLLSILREVFAKEPPVKNKQLPMARPQEQPPPPPRPPLPTELGSPRMASPQSGGQVPPRPPPKPGQVAAPSPGRYDTAPPLPPLPPKEEPRPFTQAYAPAGIGELQQYMPPQPGPVYSQASPVSQIPRQQQGMQFPTHYEQARYQHPQPQPPPQPAQLIQAPTKPSQDLLTSPFELELPSFAPGPAPPIPPNPEKYALLNTVSKTLTETLASNISQSESAAHSLLSQSHSLHSAVNTLQGEISSLTNLNKTLESNTSILTTSLHRADSVIANTHSSPAAAGPSPSSSTSPVSTPGPGIPPIDEVLVAPTVVGKQLYDLVAEENGIQQALYALQVALVKGVIGVDSWSRHTRGLAREAFLKKAVIGKIGRGMGLE